MWYVIVPPYLFDDFMCIKKYACGVQSFCRLLESELTCSILDAFWHILQPLENAEPFRLGQPEQEAQLGNGLVNWNGVVKMLFSIKDTLLRYTPFGAAKSTESPSDEL